MHVALLPRRRRDTSPVRSVSLHVARVHPSFLSGVARALQPVDTAVSGSTTATLDAAATPATRRGGGLSRT
jgi:hypothetical protein